MLPILFAALPLLLAQDSEPIPPSPNDRVIELVITEHDEIAIEGRGGTVFAEYEVEFDGTLHIWTTSELDLFLQVDDAAEASPLASDDNSGGGTTPYIALEVQTGDWLVILVAADPGATGALILQLVAATETEAGRTAKKLARDTHQAATRLANEGQWTAARDLMAEALPGVMDTEGLGRPDLLDARLKLANSMYGMGDLAGARALYESVLAAYERTLPVDHPDLLTARGNLASSMYEMGDLAGARALHESVLAARERTLPADHLDLLLARGNLALSMFEMGDVTGARALQESVLAAYERTLPVDHPYLLIARSNLATSMSQMGDLPGGRALRESVLAAYERTLPADHPDLLRARGNLAGSMREMGDLPGARGLEESVLAARERTLSADHPDLLRARLSLAVSMSQMGDLAGARALYESVLAAYERSLPADHPDLLRARGNLAASMSQMGDIPGARALRESVLAARERTLPADHPDLLRARLSLAVSMSQMGDLPGARALWESVLATYERTLPADHPELLTARLSLANSMYEMGDLAGARALHESVLAAHERTLPADHPDLLRARGNLAASMQEMGDIPGARALRESVLAARERTLPADHPELLTARGNLAISMCAMGDLAGARALLPAQVRGIRTRILASLALAPRQARQTVASESQRHSEVLFLSSPAGSELERGAFELTETLRLVAAEAARSLTRFEADPALAPILQEAGQVRSALNDLVAGAARDEAGSEGLSAELTRLSLKRDALEREANRLLAERGVVTKPVSSEGLSAALVAGDVVVGYRRISLRHVDELSGETLDAADHLLAHVLTSEGTLTRIDLGPASEFEEMAGMWRAALGAPIRGSGVLGAGDPRIEAGTPVADASRGIAVSADLGVSVTETAELDSGHILRSRVLDPVLSASKTEVKRLFVCADDLLFLLPLDALPFESEGATRVGDRLRIVSGVSFARLLEPPPPNVGEPSLLSMGGVDYDATGAAPEGLSAASAPIESTAISTTGGGTTRSTTGGGFQNLVQARHEAEGIATLFEEAFEKTPALLTYGKTTKAALFEAAPGKRYLHLATHGWFAPESVRSTEDARPQDQGFTRMGLEDRVTGLAPMTLCGLALAGANKGRDSLGRVPGILTAEELCSLDLSQCELAVLSACETNVGIRRAGQGIQSLQSALYAAGARTSITSLWKVDDAATRRLMEAFYDNLWVQGMGKADALWQAKQTLRDEGDPPAHWAGWVLTGDPD